MPNLKFRKVKNGENVDISCEFCGEPISRTSVKFGMDCKNRCAEKKYRKMTGEICPTVQPVGLPMMTDGVLQKPSE